MVSSYLHVVPNAAVQGYKHSMRLEAILEQSDAELETRATTRRALKLAVRSHSPAVGELQVVVHNISRTGLLVEAPEGSLAVGDGLLLEVPEAGPVESKVVWESGGFFGCKFRTAVSQAVVSGAVLQSEPRSTPANANDDGLVAQRGTTLFPERNFSAALAIALLLWGAIIAAVYVAVA